MHLTAYIAKSQFVYIIKERLCLRGDSLSLSCCQLRIKTWHVVVMPWLSEGDKDLASSPLGHSTIQW